jgi:hypothetical protein
MNFAKILMMAETAPSLFERNGCDRANEEFC